MTRPLVLGDPASISRLAADALAASRDLARIVAALEAAPAEPALLSSSVRRDLRRRRDHLHSRLTLLRDELAAVGTALQAHATEVARARHTAAWCEHRVREVGLVLTADRVSVPWGITGEADAAAAATHGAERDRLQAGVSALLRHDSAARQTLTKVVRQSARRLQPGSETIQPSPRPDPERRR